MKILKCLFIIGISVCILAIMGCGNKPMPKEPIKISLNVWPGYAYAYLAQQKGFFKKNNVEVELILKESTPESLKLFTDGEVEGCFDIFTDIIMIVAKGIPAKIVCIVDFSTTGDVIIGQPDIQSLAELKGRVVSFEGINTFSNIFVLNALEKAGVNEYEVRFENIKAHDVLAALEEKRIDAGHTWEPTKSKALNKGYKILACAGDYSGIITDVLIFTPKVIEERPDEIRAIVNSLFEARTYLNEHRDEAVNIMADKIEMSKEEMAIGLEGLYQPNLKSNFELLTTPSSIVYTAGIGILDFYLKRGQLSSDLDINNIIEPKIIAELGKK
jgi:NitT/TauT family transport system substrate-binding protein